MEIMFLVVALILGIIVCVVVFSVYTFWNKRRNERLINSSSQQIKKRPVKSSLPPAATINQEDKKNTLENKVKVEEPKVKPTAKKIMHEPNNNLIDKSSIAPTQSGGLADDLARQEKLVQAVYEKRARKEEAYKRMHRQKVADSLREMEGFLTVHKDNLPEKWKEMNAQLSIMERKIQGIKGKQLERKNRDMLIKRIERYKGELIAVGNEIRRHKEQQSTRIKTLELRSREEKVDQEVADRLSRCDLKSAQMASPNKLSSLRVKGYQETSPLLAKKVVSHVKKVDIEFDRRQKQLEDMVSQLQKRISNK